MSEPIIKFFFIDRNYSLPNRIKLKKFILQIFKKHHKKVSSLSYIFCSDKYLLQINRKHLSHDNYTDIITFDLSENSSLVAEIYISIDRVKENAEKFNVSFSTELKRVMFHGVLHLCGYQDKSKLEISLMRKMEEDLLKLWARST